MEAAQPSDPAGISDEALVERACGGEEEAFTLLYERYYARIYGFLDRRLGNRADVEETVQETFLNLFRSIRSYRREAPFAAWVFGLTRRTLAGRFKKRRVETVALDEQEIHPNGPEAAALRRVPNPHESYECRERIAALERAIRDELSEEQRRLFQLHHLEHHSIGEIARTMKRSEDAIKSHLYRARKLLLAR
jgi:RNA polymerase sigma-70 factor (ECF subfamily)